MSERATSAYRLPRTAIPQRYEIRIEPDLAASRFSGEEQIHLEVREDAEEIVLNAAGLKIDAAAIADGQGGPRALAVNLDEAAERVRLVSPQSLAPGPWRLSLRFHGALNDQLRGFYSSAIKGPGGSEGGNLAVTQFEATDARRAFPCWDEPAFKAVFQVTLVIPDDLAAVSNTAILREEPLPERRQKAVTFAPTIPLSTYLVAWVIGPLVASEARAAGRTPIRVWCVPGKERLARFALDIAEFSLGFFEEYYGIPYPGDKLDLIAIPDFAFGAMENLGAITFRETALLVDAEQASHTERVRVADVVAHEIAHMWFGDLVTMAWWNGLWLNEAFATFMEVRAVDAWRPAWQRWGAFSVSRAAALSVDGLRASRPVEFEVVAPRDAEAMFDVLTYEKGGAVLRMLEQFLTPEVFRAGIRKYLADHRFGTAETTDLWQALGEVSRQPIPDTMNGWIFREGYPLVTVDLLADGQTLSLSQRRFLYDSDGSEAPGTWRVPVALRAGVGGNCRQTRHLLDAPESRLTLPGAVEWAVANDGGHGFYRVRYGPTLLARLTADPQAILAPIERFNLVSDAWAMALAGLLPIADYLDLAARFRSEADRNVWAVLLASLAYLDRILRPEDRGGLQRWIRGQLGPACGRLGWLPPPGEDELTRQLRGELLQGLGVLGDDPAIQVEAQARYARSERDPSAVDADVLPAVIAIVGRNGDAVRYEDFLGRFRTAATPQEEQRFLQGLAGFRDPALVRRTLDLTLGPAVRSQDAPLLLRTLLVGVHSRELAWEFVKGHWPELTRKLPGLTGLRRMCEGITGLATRELEADVRAFFGARPGVLGGKTLEQYLEQLHVAVRFREREAGALAAYLAR